MEKKNSERFIGEDETFLRTNLSRSTRFRAEKRGEFPRRRQISPGRIAWLASEVDAWVAARAQSFKDGRR